MDAPRGTGLQDAARRWRETDLHSLLSRAALSVGAGSGIDQGMWTLPSEVEHPIVLAAGIPDSETLPVQDLREALERVLATAQNEALRYGGSQGFEGLRRALAQRQSRPEGVPMGPENFAIDNGSAGAIDTICKAFLDPGDVVIVEAPTFSGSTRTFQGHLAKIVQVPLDDHGILMQPVAQAMEQVEASGQRVKLVYTICDFHNPTGATMALERRRALLRLCAEHRAVIVEDAAYADIYFDVPPPVSLYSLSGGDGVLKVGSFSKTIATGLRVGWVQGRADLIAALVKVKFDMGNSPLLQRALAEYVDSGKLDQHLDLVRPVYSEKCRRLARSLRAHCPQYFNFKTPNGGFYLWLECTGPQASGVRREAARGGVIFPMGATFFLDREKDDTTHLRLAFSAAKTEDLDQVGPLLKLACDRSIGEA